MRGWVYDPHSGGIKIPDSVKQVVTKRITEYAAEKITGNTVLLDIRFKTQFCYIGVFREPTLPSDEYFKTSGDTVEAYLERASKIPEKMCRIRYFGDIEKWSYAFFSYSSETYEPCYLNNGTFLGTPEEAFEASYRLY